MNPFAVLGRVQADYRKYVESFQLIGSPDIPPLLAHEIEHGDLLWKEPFVSQPRRWKPGAAWGTAASRAATCARSAGASSP